MSYKLAQHHADVRAHRAINAYHSSDKQRAKTDTRPGRATRRATYTRRSARARYEAHGPTLRREPLQRVELYLGAQHAMLITRIGDIPAERWRVLWKGTLDTFAHPDGRGADVSENGGGAER